ncbi:hypothetical protein [Hyphomonas sp.]|uniref:hypothetical protein n=1 Tax=Hyphomonas sp. TaxID=87 RepID=UPI0030F50ACE
MFYLFHHIPKTAGTSVRVALSKMFQVHEDYHKNISREEMERYVKDRINLSELTERDILCGHWNIIGGRLWEKYPEIDDVPVRKIAFFRPPLDTALSGVRFNVRNGHISDQRANEMLLKRVNYFATTLGCDSENYRQRIDSYWHVGLTSRVQDSMDFIADTISADRVKVARRNVTDPASVQFSDAAIAEFKERSKFDQEIYDYAASVANTAYDAIRQSAVENQ